MLFLLLVVAVVFISESEAKKQPKKGKDVKRNQGKGEAKADGSAGKTDHAKYVLPWSSFVRGLNFQTN